ncbi:MAG: endonuclease [Muribaculaceae bacterium]|nr:endonuclease [Muribaculaceae bacterium]
MRFISSCATALLALVCSTAIYADAPAGYYSSLNGKSDAELKTAIYSLVHNFTLISSYSALPSYFEKTDVYPESNRWWDMYSDIPLYAPSFRGLNREHSFPKSWWGGSTSVSAYVDLNHLYPSEMKANSAKSNYPLGEVDMANASFDNGVCYVGPGRRGQGGGASKVFEPNDEYKGDFARTYFYMVTCYQNLSWKYTYMLEQNTYPTLSPWAVTLLMKWHRADPVSQKEIDRNEAVYGIQGNRNPFIDMPELAEYLWGTKKGENFKPGGVVVDPVSDPELIAPTKNMELQFGQVAVGNEYTKQLYVKTKNVKSIDVTIYSGNSAMFVSALNKIDGSKSNSEDGFWLPVKYKPGDVGVHESKVLLDWGEGSRAVVLRGECLPVPVLTACTALDPTDIEADRYTANWTAPADEVIDYYMVTRTRYVGGNTYEEKLPAEDTSLEITGFDESDSEAYYVESVRLNTYSPKSNVVFVNHSGISGVETDEPLVVRGYEGFMRFDCAVPQTNCRIFDMSGREIRVVDTIEFNLDVEMPQGIYIVTTDQHSTPVKVIVR